MKKIRAALIVDSQSLTFWQKTALDRAMDLIDIKLVLSCQNNFTKRRYFRNFLYYVLNFCCLRNSYTKRYSTNNIQGKKINFKCYFQGNWQGIPKPIHNELRNNKVEIIIKFGMSLLLIEDYLSKISILSFHHGNPEKYRGRPAGFYELLENQKKNGIIVQELTNQIDAGRIFAFGNSKIVHHSYKRTVKNFFAASKYLLRSAVINYTKKETISLNNEGKNYRLPSNLLVLKFLLTLLARKVSWLTYGVFIEKRWSVGMMNFKNTLRGTLTIKKQNLEIVPQLPKYSFYADPFFSLDGKKIRLEGLNKYNGLGEIIEVERNNIFSQKVLLKNYHYSYPASFEINGEEFLFPEVAAHSEPQLIKIGQTHNNKIKLHGFEKERLIDATLFFDKKTVFIFFGLQVNSEDTLHLYFANDILSKFREHPCSPIKIDPEGARMGGGVLRAKNKLFRLGQNNCFRYGENLKVFEIIKLNRKVYEESLIGEINIKDGYGPHTWNVHKNKVLLDFYFETFSVFASFRRIMGKIKRN